jgi:energy-coupling factor transporter ATP-binding protein EcfA2
MRSHLGQVSQGTRSRSIFSHKNFFLICKECKNRLSFSPENLSFRFSPRSGSGKSTLLKHIAASLPKSTPLRLLNVRPNEAAGYSEDHQSCSRLSEMNSLKTVEKNAVIFVEDLIHMSKKDEIVLRHSINYDAHHKSQKIYCIAHTVHKNSLWSLIPLFNYLVFTSSASNSPLLRLLLNYFKLDKPVVQAYLDFFRSGRKKLEVAYPYFYFNTSTMTFGYSKHFLLKKTLRIVEPPQDENSFLESPLLGASKQMVQKVVVDSAKTLFTNLSSTHPHQAEACAIFGIVLPSLLQKTDCAEQFLNQTDLTVNFRSKQGGNLVRVSLVDYILDLVSPTSLAQQSRLMAIHKYVQTRCSIPAHLIRNKAYE